MTILEQLVQFENQNTPTLVSFKFLLQLQKFIASRLRDTAPLASFIPTDGVHKRCEVEQPTAIPRVISGEMSL
jgi:hypothetical protein